MDERALEARLAECERERDEYRAGMLSQGTATAKVEAQLTETQRLLDVQLAVTDKLEAEVKRTKDRFDDYCMSWRGLDREADKVCVKCGGSGQRLYSNTSTWRNCAGGQAMTRDVCDRCWGSGDESRPWPSWRENEKAEAELAALRAALEEVDKWDLQWADGLDSNVERIKKIVRDALER